MKRLIELQSSVVVELPPFAMEFVQNILMRLREHDAETFEHCFRVGLGCLGTAREMGLNALDEAICMYAGLLHDIGKFKVPTAVINKPGKLTQDEYEIMKKHTEYGVELIAPLVGLPFFKKVSDAIHYHHERVDGRGYHSLSAERIPFAAKVILVVDTVDAMTQDRPYRKGCTMERATDELIQCSGTQFDPAVVDAYLGRDHRHEKIAA